MFWPRLISSEFRYMPLHTQTQKTNLFSQRLSQQANIDIYFLIFLLIKCVPSEKGLTGHRQTLWRSSEWAKLTVTHWDGCQCRWQPIKFKEIGPWKPAWQHVKWHLSVTWSSEYGLCTRKQCCRLKIIISIQYIGYIFCGIESYMPLSNSKKHNLKRRCWNDSRKAWLWTEYWKSFNKGWQTWQANRLHWSLLMRKGSKRIFLFAQKKRVY